MTVSPRELSNEQLQALSALARQVINQLELRLTLKRLTRTLAQKQAALDEINELRTILPICSYCKKVRDDEDFWHQVDDYIASHSEIQFSHGICPECYPIVMKKMNLNPEAET